MPSLDRRTFPHHAFFTDGHGIGQENLFNVLKAYSLQVHLSNHSDSASYCSSIDTIPRLDTVRVFPSSPLYYY
ncbi:hypothetical protein Ac2012v2_004946 [Leucoagaricus gongylophorus]